VGTKSFHAGRQKDERIVGNDEAKSRFLQFCELTFERVEEFKYLRTNLTNQISIAEEIESRLRSGGACYH